MLGQLPLCNAAHFGGFVVDHFSEPVVLDHGNRHDLVLGLHVARQDHPHSHCVRSLHHDNKENSTGGGPEHDGVGERGRWQHGGVGRGQRGRHDQVQWVLTNGQ